MTAPRKLVHTTLIPIRWGDMDAMGHVNNTIYFRYMEQARCEWAERLGYPVNAVGDEAIVIVNAACTFQIPLTHPGTVEVRMFTGVPGRSSVMTYYELRMQGDERLASHGDAKVVWMNPATGKSMPIPDRVRALLGES